MKKRKWYLVLLISSIIILILSYNVTSYLYGYKKDMEFKERIENYNFDTLKKINPDIVGYIRVLNTCKI